MDNQEATVIQFKDKVLPTPIKADNLSADKTFDKFFC